MHFNDLKLDNDKIHGFVSFKDNDQKKLWDYFKYLYSNLNLANIWM